MTCNMDIGVPARGLGSCSASASSPLWFRAIECFLEIRENSQKIYLNGNLELRNSCSKVANILG